MKSFRLNGPARLIAFFAIITAPMAAASAQSNAAPATPPAPAAVGTEPQNTLATYGDWVVRCSRAGDGAQAARICEVAQSIQVQGQQGAIAQIAVGRVNQKDPMRVTVALAPNISFPSAVKISPDDKDTQGIELSWRRCVPGGCFADAEIKDEELKRWRAQAGNGRLQFKDANGRDLALTVSFRGFSQALDGLAKSAL